MDEIDPDSESEPDLGWPTDHEFFPQVSAEGHHAKGYDIGDDREGSGQMAGASASRSALFSTHGALGSLLGVSRGRPILLDCVDLDWPILRAIHPRYPLRHAGDAQSNKVLGLL